MVQKSNQLLDKNASDRKYPKWTEAEHNTFVKALKRHGKDYDLISEEVGTKTRH